MSESADGVDRPLSFLAACLDEPERGKRRLPTLVGLMEADDEVTRLAAGWAICAVAAAHPDTVGYLAGRLADRLGGDEVTLELTHTLDYLARRYSERVEAVLSGLPDDGPAAGSPTQADRRYTDRYYGAYPPSSRDGGHGRVTDAGGVTDPRQVYTSDPDDRVDVYTDATTTGEASNEAAGDATAANESQGGSDPAEGDGSATDPADTPSGTLADRTPVVSAIASQSRFGRLHVLASHSRGRYAESYRALVGRGSAERAITLRILRRPDDLGDRPAFEAACERELERWAAVDDHPHLPSVLDWGIEPRPWLATAIAGDGLADMPDGPPGDPHHDALGLADALAHLHGNDVVHGGIDPGNVAYPNAPLGVGPEPPLLDNVGLVEAYRYHVDPATVLDPRYAAPEYFDRRFGTVDAATDVYGLGAVVYRLYAGEAPFDGPFETVRGAVTGSATPVPGDVDPDVPSAVDDVVAKAMATDKLRRYEAVDHLAAELRSIEEDEAL